jgi:hypothetical protein
MKMTSKVYCNDGSCKTKKVVFYVTKKDEDEEEDD